MSNKVATTEFPDLLNDYSPQCSRLHDVQAPPAPMSPSAVLGRSYHCSQPLVYSSEDASLTFPDIQVRSFSRSRAAKGSSRCFVYTQLSVLCEKVRTSVS